LGGRERGKLRLSEDGERIEEPLDPEDIDVITKSMTVDLLLSRVQSNMTNLQPDFQRRWGIWDQRRQSRLIESLLLRIPLPVLYAVEGETESWEIVDGIQRLSTIAKFIKHQLIAELRDTAYVTKCTSRAMSFPVEIRYPSRSS
jgi:hypothetical protein